MGRSAVIFRFLIKSVPNSLLMLPICGMELEKLGDLRFADWPRSADGSLIRAFGPREALIGRIVVSASLSIFKASLSGRATDLISTSAIRVTPGCSGMVPFAVCNVGRTEISPSDERSNSACCVGDMTKIASGKTPKAPRGVSSTPGISVLNPTFPIFSKKTGCSADWPFRTLIEAGCPWTTNL